MQSGNRGNDRTQMGKTTNNTPLGPQGAPWPPSGGPLAPTRLPCRPPLPPDHHKPHGPTCAQQGKPRAGLRVYGSGTPSWDPWGFLRVHGHPWGTIGKGPIGPHGGDVQVQQRSQRYSFPSYRNTTSNDIRIYINHDASCVCLHTCCQRNSQVHNVIVEIGGDYSSAT